jgi:hypothetical protein
MATPADQKSIDVPELQRRTIQQARTQSLVPMKYDAGMDPSMGLFDRIGEKARQEHDSAPSWLSSGPIGKVLNFGLDPDKAFSRIGGEQTPGTVPITLTPGPASAVPYDRWI